MDPYCRKRVASRHCSQGEGTGVTFECFRPIVADTIGAVARHYGVSLYERLKSAPEDMKSDTSKGDKSPNLGIEERLHYDTGFEREHYKIFVFPPENAKASSRSFRSSFESNSCPGPNR